MTPEEFNHLIHKLISMSTETEWVEFKKNNSDPIKIGENASAVSNGAALHRKPMGYLVWGVEDESHRVVGTTFQPEKSKKGNELLEPWLARMFEPRIDLRIQRGVFDGHSVVVIEVPPAVTQPTRFSGREYVRIGSATKLLADFPEKERTLWGLFREIPFESGIAVERASSDAVLELIDYPEYFRLIGIPLPDNRKSILEKLLAEGIVASNGRDRFDISNVGAILFARDLSKFDRLSRKSLRVITYKSDNRGETIKEQLGKKGYAIGFERAIRFINDQLPSNEEIGEALRREVRVYPEIAIRELVANSLIHQDFRITGSGPMVEIFEGRIEFSNPGSPLIETLRFLDKPPRSRNEKLAGLMRRMNICEERGSGVDKVIFAIELHQLPAPDFRTPGENTVAVLFAPRGFIDMDRDERIRACYQHACLQYVSGKRLTNASLRERLGIVQTNYPQASRIIRDTIAASLLKSHGDGSGSTRHASYLPFWA